MTKYDAPKMRFEKLVLFEKIAENCWSARSAYFDINENHSSELGETLDLTLSGYSCDESLSNYCLGQIRNMIGECGFNSWYDNYVQGSVGSIANTGVPRIYISFTSGFPTPTCAPTGS